MSPSSPETEAGKALYDVFALSEPRNLTAIAISQESIVRHAIPLIEAQARRDALLALRATVEGLPQTWSHEPPPGHHIHGGLDREAVLAAIDHQLGEG